MFNFEGDTRSRDNPVAPDKILEHWTGVLFGLALLYVLYHWREPVNFFLLAVFFPIYRAECVLGFVLGMTPGVGSVLPLVFAVVIAGAGWVVHRGLVPALLRAARWLLSAVR